MHEFISAGGFSPCAQQQAPLQGFGGLACFRLAPTDGVRRDAARWAAGAAGSGLASGADGSTDGPAGTVCASAWGLRLLALGGASSFRGVPLLASMTLAAGAGAGAGAAPAGGAPGALQSVPVGAAVSTGWAARRSSNGSSSSSSAAEALRAHRPAQPLFLLADATASGRRGLQGGDAELDIAGAEAVLKEMMTGQRDLGGGSSSSSGNSRVGHGGGGSSSREALPSASRAVGWAADAAAAEGVGGGFVDGGDEDDEAAEAEAEQALGMVQCGFCGRRLGRRGVRSALLCDCCHRPFHADCCRYRGVPTRRRRLQAGEGAAEGAAGGGGGGGPHADGWFHSPDCAAVSTQWFGRAAAGPQPAAAGRTWLLLPTQLRGGSASSSGGGSTSAEARNGLQQAAGVLAGEFGPRVVDAVLDSDWAVLLRDPRGTAVSAATLDLYGREVVVMDLVATAEQARGQGHNRALLDAVGDWLTEADTRHWVVSLPSPASASPLAGLGGSGGEGGAEDEVAQARRLQRQYGARGFTRLPGWQQRAWARQLPGFPEPRGGADGSVLMVRALPAAKGQRRAGERDGGEGAEDGGEGTGRGRAVVGLVRGMAGGLGGAVRGLWGYVTLSGR
ncbi:hypothetical protein HYH02_001524 [Chlamydomonas schloesseri]|uniref:Uncharacterized protein n=1 Tax=Chlamydomonas schloesseri TaxID=2026947 RepID=A0A835WSC9_9CHLO|nr:hypothetical protein HYH02_001524 [Chlamydomonas schloesseri]|eukprot:KAG2453298.1 hypothetical protein HYH02_001524 [Chlamydomonas schloesseri]